MIDHSFKNLSPEEQKEYWYSLALRHVHGIGPRTANYLCRHLHSPAEAFADIEIWKSLNVPDRIIREAKSGCWQKKAEEEWKQAEKDNVSIILWNSPWFPRMLWQVMDAPVFLYCKGNPELTRFPAIAIVGSRAASAEGLRNAFRLASSLSAAGITIVSGMALGIDAAAHAGAMQEIGKSIGVLGTGINHIYPWTNRHIFEDMEAEGLILSEFPPSTPPQARNFPIRNRLISGLSFGVIVVEAAEKSGSLITARTALEQNREVLAVPGRPFSSESSGCQNLIRAGACPVFTVDDVLSHLANELKNHPLYKESENPAPRPIVPVQAHLFADTAPRHTAKETEFEGKETVEELAGDNGAKILQCLTTNGRMHMDQLGQMLGLSNEKLSPLLLALELTGHIARHPGAFYDLA